MNRKDRLGTGKSVHPAPKIAHLATPVVATGAPHVLTHLSSKMAGVNVHLTIRWRPMVRVWSTLKKKKTRCGMRPRALMASSNGRQLMSRA